MCRWIIVFKCTPDTTRPWNRPMDNSRRSDWSGNSCSIRKIRCTLWRGEFAISTYPRISVWFTTKTHEYSSSEEFRSDIVPKGCTKICSWSHLVIHEEFKVVSNFRRDSIRNYYGKWLLCWTRASGIGNCHERNHRRWSNRKSWRRRT